ncbi:MAG: hypothetical protein OER96_05840 [Gammaproteobacteria bacterium]|nr:hypothetical protein [Gammaproteobacteria bacterium]
MIDLFGRSKMFVFVALFFSFNNVFAQDQTPYPAMHKAFDALSYLLPLSLAGQDGDAKTDFSLLEEKLKQLVESSDRLDEHAKGREAEFKSIARSFDATVKQVDQAFRNERPQDALFLLMDLTQNCVACHSRLPSAANFPFGQRLMARINVDTMDRRDVAQLYVATRQFDGALKILEEVVVDNDVTPIDLDIDGTLVDYLDISISVKQDFAPIRTMLDKLQVRPDLPFYMNRHAEAWRISMDGLEGELKAPPSVARARELFNTATLMTAAPAGRERIIHDLLAASMLRRLVDQRETTDIPNELLAEAYYVLSIIELRTINPNPTVPQMEFLLEAAIRSDPDGLFAKRAYALLEEYSYFSYEGVPWFGTDEPMIKMGELRSMIGLDQ